MRGWTIAGLIVIVLMLLVPPREVTVFDSYAAAADDLIRLEGVPDFDPPGEHESTTVIYRPVGAELPDEIGHGERVEDSSLATTRLLLQIVVVVVVFGGMGLITSGGGQNTPSESG